MSRRLVVSIALGVGGLAHASAGWAQRAQQAQQAQPPPVPPAPVAEEPAPPPASSSPPAPAEPVAAPTGDAARDVGRAGPPRLLPAEDKAPSADGEPRPAGAVSPTAAAQERDARFAPFGYLRAQWTGVLDDPEVAAVGRSDGFSLQHARLGVRGDLGGRVAYEVSLDGAVDERERVNVPNGRLRVGLRDAYLDANLRALPFASIPGVVRAGRFEPWFDPEGYEADTTRAFIDRALESHGVSAGEGWETEGLAPGRSMGVALRLQALPWRAAEELAQRPALFLEVAATNGAAEFASVNDNNALALSAAARLELPGRGWVQAAARRNQRTEGELPFQQEETDLAASLGAGVRLGPLSLGGGGLFVHTTFATTGGGAQRGWGAHGQALWRIVERDARSLELGYRFAILDPSSLVVTDRLMEHTAGMVLGLPTWRMRLLLNATHAVEQAGRSLRNSRGEIVVELVL